MTIYKCDCGKENRALHKTTTVFRDGKWVVKQAECSCGKYMKCEEPTEIEVPNIIRTEPTLRKK